MKTGTLMRAAAVMLAMFVASAAYAQALNSGASPIALNATLGESLTLSLSASTDSFSIAKYLVQGLVKDSEG